MKQFVENPLKRRDELILPAILFESGDQPMYPMRGALALTIMASAVSAAPPSRTEAELLTKTQALVDAVAPGNKAPWNEALDPSYVGVDENGTVKSKDEVLREIEPLPAGLEGHIKVENFRVRQTGTLAVAAYDLQESLDYRGQPLHTRFRSLDTWLRTKAGWRLMAQHTSAVLKDPPAIKLSQDELCAYSGKYQLTPEIQTTIKCVADGIEAERAGRPSVTYRPEVKDLFFAPGQPRSRRIFQRGPDGSIVSFVDRREGEDIRWARIAGQ
jgi:hypothetical protein